MLSVCGCVLWRTGQRTVSSPTTFKVYPYVFGLITVKTSFFLSEQGVHALLVIMVSEVCDVRVSTL